MADLSPRIFEAIMLVCFGCSWPFAIAKTIRTKTVKGKSIVFISLIFTGYVAGVVFKLIGHLDGVVLLYITNGSLVFAEIVLYFRYRKPAETSRGDGLPQKPGVRRQPVAASASEAAGSRIEMVPSSNISGC